MACSLKGRRWILVRWKILPNATYVLAGELALGRLLAGELPRPAFPPRLRETAPTS
jgi:hypothetical protein